MTPEQFHTINQLAGFYDRYPRLKVEIRKVDSGIIHFRANYLVPFDHSEDTRHWPESQSHWIWPNGEES